MANDSMNIGASGGGGYSYAYTKPRESEKEIKSENGALKMPTTSTSATTLETKSGNSKKAEDGGGEKKVKTLYEERQEELKKAEEERKRKEEEEKRAEYLRELSDELNKRMNSFSEKIKFGVNDRTNSIVVSILEKNNDRVLKELSLEDAQKLFHRLDYVLGVLFDRMG